MKKQWLVISSMVVLFTMLLAACRNQPAAGDANQSVTTSVLVGTSSVTNILSDSSVSKETSSMMEKSQTSTQIKSSASGVKSSARSSLSTKSNTQTSKTSTSRQSRVQPSSNSTKPSSSKVPSRFDTNEVHAISVESEICIAVGETRKVVTFIVPGNAEGRHEVRAEISDPKVLQITKPYQNRIMYVKGLTVGECTITFTAPNGVTAQTKITVTEKAES